MLTIKKHLSLKPLIEGFKNKLADAADPRRKNSIDYPILNTALSTLACMFYKSGSLLKFQRNMKKRLYRSNLETQFDVTNIPCDNQIRSIISSISPDQFSGVFKDYLHRLQRGKYLAKFKFDESYLVALDGTQYYKSEDVHCSECMQKKKRNGKIEYSHMVVQAVICHPNQSQILPLMPEAVNQHDGDDKQDCEINASKRLLPKIRKDYPKMNFIWLADSIYATSPFIQSILDEDESFIFRIKEGDHKYLYQCLKNSSYSKHRTTTGNQSIAYHWYESIPLNKSSDIKVTVMKAFSVTTDKDGKASSKLIGVWATNLEVNQNNVVKIVQSARSRWKVENQCFNATKNAGYNLAHNWGHVNGESFNFYILVMLAFYIHQIFELTDKLFQMCRKVCVTYTDLWEDLTGMFKLILFGSWEHMLVQCIKNNGGDPPQVI